MQSAGHETKADMLQTIGLDSPLRAFSFAVKMRCTHRQLREAPPGHSRPKAGGCNNGEEGAGAT